MKFEKPGLPFMVPPYPPYGFADKIAREILSVQPIPRRPIGTSAWIDQELRRGYVYNPYIPLATAVPLRGYFKAKIKWRRIQRLIRKAICCFLGHIWESTDVIMGFKLAAFFGCGYIKRYNRCRRCWGVRRRND